MRGKSKSEKIVRDIKRHTRRKYSSEDKIRIVLEGLRGETSIAEICRRESINPNVYYKWSKDFLEAGKKRLDGDTVREALRGEKVAFIFKTDIYKFKPMSRTHGAVYIWWA